MQEESISAAGEVFEKGNLVLVAVLTVVLKGVLIEVVEDSRLVRDKLIDGAEVLGCCHVHGFGGGGNSVIPHIAL